MNIKEGIRQNYEKDEPFHMFERSIGGPLKTRQLEFVVDYLQSFSGRILDVACGPGMFSVALADRNLVTGIDFSQNMITAAKQLAEEDNVGAHFFVADAEHLPIANEKFDVVLLMDVSHHMTNTTLLNVATECYRVLKPDGIFITDFKNSLNLALYWSYKMRSAEDFYLQSRTCGEMKQLLSLFSIIQKKGHGFPGSVFSPYQTLICKKEKVLQ